MSTIQWDTRNEPSPEFLAAWNDMLALAAHTNFGFDPRYLQWEARHGRFVLAVLIREGGRTGGIILRREGLVLRSGLPWRSQMLLEQADPDDPAGMNVGDSEWLFGLAQRFAGGRRLESFAPYDPSRPVAAFLAGATLVRTLKDADEAILKSLSSDKRRMIKRAIGEGFEVVEVTSVEQMKRFAALQCETERRRGVSSVVHADPAPGEHWREWELPWMWLLLAVRRGEIEAGSGYGIYPGKMVDYRTNASTLEAKNLGANVLLAYEALRRGRDRGYRWLNWCGATEFKRQMGGTRIDIVCRLGGGPIWAVPNLVTMAVHRARATLAARRRTRRVPSPAPAKTGRASG